MTSWAGILQFLRDNQVGDLTGIVGLIGLGLTFWQVWQAKSAATAAKEAAKNAQTSIRFFDIVVDCSAAIGALEDIKRMHRQPNRDLLLERYAASRKMLITIKAAGDDLHQNHQETLQSAISMIAQLERTLEKSNAQPLAADAHRTNNLISKNIDALVEVLLDIKKSRNGV